MSARLFFDLGEPFVRVLRGNNGRQELFRIGKGLRNAYRGRGLCLLRGQLFIIRRPHQMRRAKCHLWGKTISIKRTSFPPGRGSPSSPYLANGGGFGHGLLGSGGGCGGGLFVGVWLPGAVAHDEIAENHAVQGLA